MENVRKILRTFCICNFAVCIVRAGANSKLQMQNSKFKKVSGYFAFVILHLAL